MRNPIRRWWRRRQLKNGKQTPTRFMRTLKWAWRIGLLLIVVDTFYLILIWPDWDQFAAGEIPKSRFIRNYEAQMQDQVYRTGLHWRPVPYKWMPKHLSRAVIVAEDARFYTHHGFDLLAFKEAMDTNLERMEFKYGASTISQQTVKNLFLTGSRNPLRKWHELVLTVGMEFNLDKNRILETYLNIAEFGEGIYGVEAAAQHYFGKSVYALDELEAAELAATLPSPIKHNPQTRTKRFVKRSHKIYRWMQAHKQN
jgi:monofunctional biosynthetic peptidoglycan transglycosylase